MIRCSRLRPTDLFVSRQSVGNLCTLVLVAIADTLVPNSPPLSLATIVGSGLIVASFAGLIVGARREAQLEHEKVQQLKAIVV